MVLKASLEKCMNNHKNQNIKIFVTGPSGAGKTTFIRSISQSEVLTTDVPCTNAKGKKETTVAMDYGSLYLDRYSIHLFGSPGQDRFDFTWDILRQGALGVIMLVGGHDPEQLPLLKKMHDKFLTELTIPYILGVTHQDLAEVWTPAEVADYLEIDPFLCVGINALDENSATDVLVRLFEIIEKEIEG
ncbi:GTPase [Candidatus Methylacidiphilum fumarolicum]|uniref:Predicted GTPase n=3 Tax=Candidatus Methylacidiphilum fumarolicum TaxID=591154 RepID=I0K169_METFB|nr:GTPase [Candidatus Methylacidiphilum fumarolicum]TFE77821.1 GTPase [Candidatus Methylacidiphilum fumarolicum]CAI9086757.1 Predicted GTPase [Candidatus Methylacidiphilum fumarolicum]CCG93238.1 Predicted GTPase [Methylacidiphilum fumariolicum SolV]